MTAEAQSRLWPRREELRIAETTGVFEEPGGEAAALLGHHGAEHRAGNVRHGNRCLGHAASGATGQGNGFAATERANLWDDDLLNLRVGRLIPFHVAHFFDLAGLRESFVPGDAPAEVAGEKALADAVSVSDTTDGPEVGQEFLFGDLLPLGNNVLWHDEERVLAANSFAVEKGGDGLAEPLLPGEDASVFHTEFCDVLDLEGFEESAVEERVGHKDLLSINK